MNQQSLPIELSTPVQFIKGVGPDRAGLFQRLELHTAQDVLFFFPRDYLDSSEKRTIQELADDQSVSLVGEVVEIDQRTTSNSGNMLGVLVREAEDHVRAVWFNQAFMRAKFQKGQTVMLSGTPRRRGLGWEFVHPRVTFLDAAEEPSGQILPVYRLTDGLRQSQIRRVTVRVAEILAGKIPDVFPDEFLAKHQLCSIQAALLNVHQPSDDHALTLARTRLVFQELLVMQLALAVRQKHLESRESAPPLCIDVKIDSRIRRLFPFQLTEGQNRVIREIARDVARPVPMNRLLQGDVGSGKTAVAAYVMLAAVAHGKQAVLMAPTEVLARQHFQTLSGLLSRSQVEMRLLTGSASARDRREILEGLASGVVNILVGTQAVIQQEIAFHRLGLLIIDEQHKFGVMQRAVLRNELDPHCLIMTATPIPRTVAMTVFGDLDVSSLRGSPPGRQPIHTYLVTESQRDRWWEFFRRKLREGQQGFVVSPVVSDDTNSRTSAEAALENLANGQLADFRLDLLHGRMTPTEKSAAMKAFQDGRTQVLVATSVVEVGIDVPNANLMTIEHGESFGLAQLHQLRGRVGRGSHSGFVAVFASPGNDEADQRLKAFESSTDGFELAELDFQLRGPGELFGTRQHGLPPLMVADLRRDADVLQRARAAAREMIDIDPGLRDPQFERLRRMVLNRYGTVLELGNIG